MTSKHQNIDTQMAGESVQQSAASPAATSTVSPRTPVGARHSWASRRQGFMALKRNLSGKVA